MSDRLLKNLLPYCVTQRNCYWHLEYGFASNKTWKLSGSWYSHFSPASTKTWKMFSYHDILTWSWHLLILPLQQFVEIFAILCSLIKNQYKLQKVLNFALFLTIVGYVKTFDDHRGAMVKIVASKREVPGSIFIKSTIGVRQEVFPEFKVLPSSPLN